MQERHCVCQLCAVCQLYFFKSKATRKQLCEQMLSSHTSKIRKMPKCCLNPGMQCKQMLSTYTQRQDRMPKCCPNYPNPGRGCQVRPHFGSARFAHFSRIPHFCRVSFFCWISAGFGKFGGRCGGRSAVQYLGLFVCTKVSVSHRNTVQCSAIQGPLKIMPNYCSAVHYLTSIVQKSSNTIHYSAI